MYENDNFNVYAPGLVDALTIRTCCALTDPPVFRSPRNCTLDELSGAKLVNSPLAPETPPPGCAVPLAPVVVPALVPPPTMAVTRLALALPTLRILRLSVKRPPGCNWDTSVL